MAEYIISEKAFEDLNNIWLYTAEIWSVEQANRYYNLLVDEIEYVSETTQPRYYTNDSRGDRCSHHQGSGVFSQSMNPFYDKHTFSFLNILQE